MKWFTVEVTLEPVVNDDWDKHMRAIDAVPGALLLQDAEQPSIAFPVEASDPLKAARFVEGVLSIVELAAVSGEISDLPECDFDMEDTNESPVSQTPVTRAVSDWFEKTPPTPTKRELQHS